MVLKLKNVPRHGLQTDYVVNINKRTVKKSDTWCRDNVKFFWNYITQDGGTVNFYFLDPQDLTTFKSTFAS